MSTHLKDEKEEVLKKIHTFWVYISWCFIKKLMTETAVRGENHIAQSNRKETLRQPTERSNAKNGNSDTERKPADLLNVGYLRVWVPFLMNTCNYSE